MRLDGRNDIMSVKSTWSTLHPELKACVPPCPRGITKEIKQTHTLKKVFSDKIFYVLVYTFFYGKVQAKHLFMFLHIFLTFNVTKTDILLCLQSLDLFAILIKLRAFNHSL